MGKLYTEIDDGLKAWIEKHQMFFVSTAPQSPEHHLNTSPKGLDTFRILGPNRGDYLDFTGSGIETIAHLRENGRILIMMSAFEGVPNIVRLYGRGRVHFESSEEFKSLVSNFNEYPGTRAVIDVEVHRISDSCGYAVPLYSFQGHRETLSKWAQQKGAEGVKEYQQGKNLMSIDGLPGMLMNEDSNA